jgi:hypothetical protein
MVEKGLFSQNQIPAPQMMRAHIASKIPPLFYWDGYQLIWVMNETGESERYRKCIKKLWVGSAST